MLLAVDIGNTNIKIGLFESDKLVHSFKMSTDIKRTADEHKSVLKQLLQDSKIDFLKIDGIIVSSVIPQLDYSFDRMLYNLFNIKPMIVGVGIKTGLCIKYEFPRELGSDRIITSVAALKKYGAPFVLVDYGTATTYNVVNAKEEFLGGAITLGIRSTVDALSAVASKLPQVEISSPQKAIAQSTAKAIQSGVVYGAVGQTMYIVDKIKKELKDSSVKVIATGGLSYLVAEQEHIFDYVDKELSLIGLNVIYNLNK